MIRFAVIGTNTITDKFLQAASTLPDFKLCAVYSRTLVRAQEYAQKNNVSLVFDSLEALADSDQIDAVYIASPNFCHAAQSILMMQHHKHVLCEKPIASNASEFQQMYNTAIKNQVILLEAMRSVFFSWFCSVRSPAPVLGTIRQVDFLSVNIPAAMTISKRGSSKTLSIPHFPTAPDGHRRLLCPSARLPVWHAGFDSEAAAFSYPTASKAPARFFYSTRICRQRSGIPKSRFSICVPDSGEKPRPC